MPRVTITVPEKNAQPYRFQLDREVVSLGRGGENDIVIDSGSVSGNHAEMRRIKGGYELHDTGSTNGIKLDGVRYDVIPLLSGTTVHIGDVAFDFLLTDEELAILDGEKPSEKSPERQASPLQAAEMLPPLKPLPPVDNVPAMKPLPPRNIYTPAHSSSGGGLGTLLMLLILAAAAFFAGLAVRYQKETGGSLLEAVRARHFTTKAAPATPVEPAAK
jgi:pSer/pThr/pTyr-binding forkhead associated (FHA) protein